MASGAKAVPKILGTVVCTPSTAEVGQSVCIDVRSPDGKPYDNSESVPISINGVPGSKHYVVWNRWGTKTVRVVAGRPGAIEKLTATVTINKPKDKTVRPALKVRWS